MSSGNSHDERSAATNVEIVGPVDEPGFKGWKVIANGLHVATHRTKREAEDDAHSWEAMLDA